MEEQYVSIKTAKLAKENGFKGICCTHSYGCDGHFYYNLPLNNVDDEDLGIAAPSQSILSKWLIEKYEIHVEVVFWHYKDSHYCKYTYNVTSPLENLTKNALWFNSYEEAKEAGLQEAFNYIRNN